MYYSIKLRCLTLLCLTLCSQAVFSDDDAAENALRATVRLSGGGASGTGFFVAIGEGDGAKTVLVSAAHVFDDMKAAECTLVLRRREDDGQYKREEMQLTIRKDDKPLWKRHNEGDVAAMEMKLPPGTDIKPLVLDQVADEKFAADRKIRVAKEVFIPCFPVGLESNSIGWPILRRGSIASHPLTPLKSAKTMFVDFSTFGGDSGSPVMLCEGDRPIVVGVVSSMQRQSDRTIMPFEERTVHTPLGLSVVVQSPLVRETIEMLEK